MRIRRFLQFNLKTLLVVTAIFCVLLAREVQRADRQARSAYQIRRMNGGVGYDVFVPAGSELRMLLGKDSLATARQVDFSDCSRLTAARLNRLQKLARLDLSRTQVTNAGKAQLKRVLPNCSL